MSDIAPEGHGFKADMPNSFRYTRGILPRSASEDLAYYAQLPKLAKCVGAQIRTNVRRVGIDIISREESTRVVRENPNIRYGGLYGELVRLRDKTAPQLNDYAEVLVGDVVTRQVSPDVCLISQEIAAEDEVWLSEEWALLLASISKVIKGEVHLTEPDNYYFDIAMYHPENTDGIDIVTEYIADKASKSVEVSQVYLFSPPKPT